MANKLLCYRLQVQSRRDREHKDLFCFDDTHDLLAELQNWLADLQTVKYRDYSQTRVILREPTDVLDINERTIIGQITTGRTGSGSKILDDQGLLKTNKLTSDLDTISLFYLVHIPQPGRDGIIVCQDHDGLNPFQCLRGYLNMKFSGSFKKHKLCISAIVFNQIIDRFLQDGQIISLELKKRMQERDEVDKVNPDQDRFDNPFITHLITPDREAKHLKRSIVEDMLNIYGQTGTKRYLNFDFENAKMTLEAGEKTRKINLEDIYSRANVWPLSDDIDLDTNRVPKYDAVKEEALDLLKSFPV